MLVAVRHDVLGHPLAQARHAREQGRRGGVHIDPDRVDAVLDDGVERARELVLGQIVLILADPDRLRVDLHQLGQGSCKRRAIETAPRNETSSSGSSWLA